MSKTIEKAKERQDYLFNEMASLMDALASPVRLKIIHFLTQAPHSVEQLSLKLGQTVANTSMHLKKMQREGILKIETMAQKRIYSLAQGEMRDLRDARLLLTPTVEWLATAVARSQVKTLQRLTVLQPMQCVGWLRML